MPQCPFCWHTVEPGGKTQYCEHHSRADYSQSDYDRKSKLVASKYSEFGRRIGSVRDLTLLTENRSKALVVRELSTRDWIGAYEREFNPQEAVRDMDCINDLFVRGDDRRRWLSLFRLYARCLRYAPLDTALSRTEHIDNPIKYAEAICKHVNELAALRWVMIRPSNLMLLLIRRDHDAYLERSAIRPRGRARNEQVRAEVRRLVATRPEITDAELAGVLRLSRQRVNKIRNELRKSRAAPT